IAADQGMDIKAVAPLVTRPLTTLIYLDEEIKTPADLSGKTIGFTMPGVTEMMLRVFADINGITDYTPVNMGVPSLISNEVDAVMVPCKTYDTMGMEQQGYDARLFELEKYGIPDYEELIFVAGSKTLDEKAEAIRGFVKAIRIALAEVQIDPEIAMGLYLEALPEADEARETRAYELTRPYFAGPEGHDPVKWQAFADFALARGLIRNRVDTADLIHTWE
ncbi:MAG: ABC transporter substrate-binding protein, partial [Desulfobacterales bacterium]|nr:ABC transporter substrate-binding protein [Desulfobacterales bacterium]